MVSTHLISLILRFLPANIGGYGVSNTQAKADVVCFSKTTTMVNEEGIQSADTISDEQRVGPNVPVTCQIRQSEKANETNQKVC